MEDGMEDLIVNERDFFHNETSYKRYCLGKKYALKINEYLDQGFLVFDEYDEPVQKSDRFVFEEGEIYLKSDRVMSCYVGSVFHEKTGRIYLMDDEFSPKALKEKFGSFSIVDPKNIIKVKL